MVDAFQAMTGPMTASLDRDTARSRHDLDDAGQALATTHPVVALAPGKEHGVDRGRIWQPAHGSLRVTILDTLLHQRWCA